MVERVSFGIRAFDKLIGGGVIRPSAILLLGDIGAGKTVMCQQFIWNGLKNGESGIYFCIDHSPDAVRENMAGFGWDIKPFEEKGDLILVDSFLSRKWESNEKHVIEDPFNFEQHVMAWNLLDRFENKPIRLVYDSLSSITYMETFESILRFLRDLHGVILNKNCTGLISSVRGVHEKKLEITMQQTLGNVFKLKKEGAKIFLIIEKMEATKHHQKPIQIVVVDAGVVMLQ
ncbi:MAG: RAD55 family ATPase [Candidatus Hydrothermarchaeales archaeon]